MIDLNEYDLNQLHTSFGQKNGMRILIVESEPDLMILYAEYLSALDLDVIVASDGNECLSVLKVNDFDIIILDMHLSGIIEAIDVAKEIYQIKPNQRIVLTTTNPLNRTSTIIDTLRVNKEDILVKPFMLSSLLKVIKKK
jgi:DNA-binding response OmpR family regulator